MRRLLFVSLLLLVSPLPAAELGSVSFPTSTTNAEAQAAFERGVAALHSFWYEEAADAFRRAQQLDPSMAMAYWGEAMTDNHPIWMEQDRDAALAVLKKLPGKPSTPREEEWLSALNVLYGEGEKRARDDAYAEAMAKLAAKYPDDTEAQAFHALAILGTMHRDADDARKQIRAAAILEPLLDAHPAHPGVLHYMIHAYDDPLHAPLGLRAARRYARVAPAAHHALHMPSHIFLQLGMWNEAAASNEAAYAASKAWVARAKLPSSKRDLHSLTWLHYIYLQQGRREDAKRLHAEVSSDLTSERERSTYARLLATWAVETGEAVDAAQNISGNDDEQHCATPYVDSSEASHFTAGLVAIRQGRRPTSAIAAITAVRQKSKREVEQRTLEVMELLLRALDAQKQGNLAAALDAAKRAVALEETLGAPSGPPDTFKPAHELYGELLLAAGKREEAAEQFRLSLLRTPNRRLSLEGLEHAHAP